MVYNSNNLNTQNELLMSNLMSFYKKDDVENKNLSKMMTIVNGESKISLRIIDWFVTNYAKKFFVIYDVSGCSNISRFKVYNDYKLKLKAYSKRSFDPFCRWERINIQYDDENYIETTIGQLNFFKWAIENKIVQLLFRYNFHHHIVYLFFPIYKMDQMIVLNKLLILIYNHYKL